MGAEPCLYIISHACGYVLEEQRRHSWSLRVKARKNPVSILAGSSRDVCYEARVVRHEPERCLVGRVRGQICVLNNGNKPTRLRIRSSVARSTGTGVFSGIPGAEVTLAPDESLMPGDTKCLNYEVEFPCLSLVVYRSITVVSGTEAEHTASCQEICKMADFTLPADPVPRIIDSSATLSIRHSVPPGLKASSPLASPVILSNSENLNLAVTLTAPDVTAMEPRALKSEFVLVTHDLATVLRENVSVDIVIPRREDTEPTRVSTAAQEPEPVALPGATQENRPGDEKPLADCLAEPVCVQVNRVHDFRYDKALVHQALDLPECSGDNATCEVRSVDCDEVVKRRQDGGDMVDIEAFVRVTYDVSVHGKCVKSGLRLEFSRRLMLSSPDDTRVRCEAAVMSALCTKRAEGGIACEFSVHILATSTRSEQILIPSYGLCVPRVCQHPSSLKD